MNLMTGESWVATVMMQPGKYRRFTRTKFDAKKHNTILEHFEIPGDGYVCNPGQLYLGVTLEYTGNAFSCTISRRVNHLQADLH